MTEEGRERGLMVLPFVLAALRLRETMEAGSPAYRVSSDAGRPPRWGTELRRGKKRDSSDPRRRSSREGDEPNLGRGAARDDRLAVIFASEGGAPPRGLVQDASMSREVQGPSVRSATTSTLVLAFLPSFASPSPILAL